MNSFKSLTSAGILWGGLMLGLGTSPVLAADFKTTLTVNPAISNPPVDTVIFNWSTDLTSGAVFESDLTNWSYELLDGGSSVYTETLILGGVVQPIESVPRTLDDLFFDFDLDTLTLFGWDNDYNLIQEGAAIGVTYNILGFFNDPSNNEWDITRFEDGVFSDFDFSEFSQSTEEVTPSASTPEPSTILGLLAVGSLGVLSRKRKG